VEEVRRLEIMGAQPGDEVDPPLIDSPQTAALREQAAGVLARYHQIEPAEADMLLLVLAEYLDCSVDALAGEVLRSAAHRAVRDEPPQSGDFSPDESGTPP
jgi:hypothetical protein